MGYRGEGRHSSLAGHRRGVSDRGSSAAESNGRWRMSRLQLELADDKTKYRPGEAVEGVAFWELDGPPKSIEIRLFWRTQGKGTVDAESVECQPQGGTGTRGRRPF